MITTCNVRNINRKKWMKVAEWGTCREAASVMPVGCGVKLPQSPAFRGGQQGEHY